jgi:hypothetical protein
MERQAPSVEENERPSEWLRALRETRGAYEALLRESGEVVVAAYRIALARCRASERPSTVPTAREVRAAVREVVGDATTPIPPVASVVQDCAHNGLLVIA